MKALARIQAGFCAALNPCCSERDLEAGKALVQSFGELDNIQRLGIYQRNVTGAHIAALESIYPVCREILGERVFATLARDYTWGYPTTDPDLNRYGMDFPRLLQAHEGEFAAMPYLQDLARLEYHWRQALFAPDDPPFDFDGFAGAARRPDRLTFTPGRGLYLLQSEWPVLEIWQRHRNGESPRAIEARDAPDRLVIARFEAEVTVNRIDAEDFTLLQAIQAGRTLTQLSTDPRLHDSVTRLPGLIEQGWITGFRSGEARDGDPGVQ